MARKNYNYERIMTNDGGARLVALDGNKATIIYEFMPTTIMVVDKSEILNLKDVLEGKGGEEKPAPPAAPPKPVPPVEKPESKKETVKPAIKEPLRTQATKKPKKTRPASKSPEITSAIKAVEAFRFGLVPSDIVADITVGYDELSRWVESRLPQVGEDKPKVSEICGQFGTGKSHTIAIIKQIAKKKGFLTASAEIDGRYVTLADPERLLFNLWQNLEGDGLNRITPLLELYLRSIEQGHQPPRIAPRGIDRIRDNYLTIQLLKKKGFLDQFESEYEAVLSSSNEVTASEVEKKIKKECVFDGYEFLKVRRMVGRTVADRPYNFVESLFGHAVVAGLAGYKGLVVTIDEFEIQYLSSRRDIERVSDLIRTLMNFIIGDTDHDYSPCSMFFATVGTEDHGGDAIIDHLIEECDGEFHELEEMNLSSIVDLGRKIHSLYIEAHGAVEPFDPSVAGSLFEKSEGDSGRVRSFIKHYIARLDDLHGPPNHVTV